MNLAKARDRFSMSKRLGLLAVVVAGSILAGSPARAAGPAKGPQKLTVEEAAKKMGKRVFLGTGSAMPPNLVPYMRAEALQRKGKTNVFYMSTFASASNFSPEVTAKWHPHLFFISPQNRDAAKSGAATLHRASLFELSQRIRNGAYGIDTVVVRVSPPDKDGMVSLGTTGDLTLEAVKSAIARGGQIIAEVNPNVPHANGNRIPYSSLTAVVEGGDMLAEHNGIQPAAAEQAIARNVAKLIPNRRLSTLQVGIGNSLNGVGEAVKGKRLQIWSEMGSQWVLPLMAGENPTVKKATFSFLHGTNELYGLANNNENIRIGSSNEVNNPKLIAQQPRMTAVNTALEVDLSGNVNAERIGDRIISFPGGQPDFMKGASNAKDGKGKAILAIRSVNKDGGSTIVPQLHGDVVTTPGNHVDHVVTEWGATRSLRGLDAGQRTYELLTVSHPVHREELGAAALKAGTITQKQYDKLVRSIYHSVRLAPAEMRREVADQVLAKKLITEAMHKELVAGLPAAEPVLGADGVAPPPPI